MGRLSESRISEDGLRKIISRIAERGWTQKAFMQTHYPAANGEKDLSSATWSRLKNSNYVSNIFFEGIRRTLPELGKWEDLVIDDAQVLESNTEPESISQALPEIIHRLPPPSKTELVGREEQIKALHQQLQAQQTAIVILHGMPGVGRSELAMNYARRYKSEYPGGVCWVEGGDSKLATLLLEYAVNFVSVPIPSGLQEVESRVFHCWQHWRGSHEPVLIVLDDAIDDALLDKLLSGLPSRFRVLITASKPHPKFHSIFIKPLIDNQPVELLQSLMKDDERDLEDAALRAIVERLGGLPLALHVVGAYMQRAGLDYSFTEILEKLKRQQVPDVEQGIDAVFALTWGLLSAEAQRLACLLSLLNASSINWQMATALITEVGSIGVPDSLRGVLQDYHLLQRQKRGIYDLHSVIEEYFLSKLPIVDADSTIRATVARLQWDAVRPFPLPEHPRLAEIAAVSVSALTSLEKLLRRFPEAFEQDTILPVLTTVRRYYQGQGLYGHALTLVEAVVPIVELAFSIGSSETAECYLAISRLHYFQGRSQDAADSISKALTSAETAGDELLLAKVLQVQAALYRDKAENAEDFAEAEILAKRGLEIQKRLLEETHPDTADSLMTLATIYLYAEQYGEAEPLLEEVLKVREGLGDRDHPNIGETLNGLGYLHEKQGHDKQARDFHIRTLRFRRRVHGKRHPQKAESHNNLGKVYALSEATFKKAKYHYDKAIAIFGASVYRADHAPQYGRCLSNLGDLFRALGKRDEARETLTQALSILKESCGEDHAWTRSCYNSINMLS